MKQARGMRNKNPLNIIKNKNINWKGEVKPSTDPNFAQFETLEYGLRAAFKLLQTYYTKHGCRTITQIISRWAPETENQVVAYIKAVSQRTGIAPDAPLPPMKPETQVLWCDIVLAMAMVECGLNGREQQELVPLLYEASYFPNILMLRQRRGKKEIQTTDNQWFGFSFGRDYCPTSRKIHLILLNSRIFYMV